MITRKSIPTDIIIHGAWTPPDLDIGMDEIDLWHRNRGFDQIGYHYVIRRDGTQELGRPVQYIGAHVLGFNFKSIGIVLVGGQSTHGLRTLGRDNTEAELAWAFNYTAEQMTELGILVTDLLVDFKIRRIRGHRDYPHVTKRCPGFDVGEYFRNYSIQNGLET